MGSVVGTGAAGGGGATSEKESVVGAAATSWGVVFWGFQNWAASTTSAAAALRGRIHAGVFHQDWGAGFDPAAIVSGPRLSDLVFTGPMSFCRCSRVSADF